MRQNCLTYCEMGHSFRFSSHSYSIVAKTSYNQDKNRDVACLAYGPKIGYLRPERLSNNDDFIR